MQWVLYAFDTIVYEVYFLFFWEGQWFINDVIQNLIQLKYSADTLNSVYNNNNKKHAIPFKIYLATQMCN